MVNIEELVSNSRAYLKKTNDCRVWCITDQIIALLDAGAIPIKINYRQVSGETYLHVVSYKDITFITATDEPVQKLEKYRE